MVNVDRSRSVFTDLKADDILKDLKTNAITTKCIVAYHEQK